MVNLQPSSSALDLGAIAAVPMQSLGDAVRAAYRSSFELALAEGRAKPMLFPICLVALFIVPALWLAVPHTRRRWIYHTRWLAIAFIVWSNVNYVLYVSSVNFSMAYAVGLGATWGTISSMNLIIWKRPQFDAARILRVRKPRPGPDKGQADVAVDESSRGSQLSWDGPRQRKVATDAGRMQDEHQQEEFEFVWQPYPADAPFLERLGWAADLVVSFRGAGWNWSVSCIPRPKTPHEVHLGERVDMNTVPKVTSSGYKRCTTEAEFVRDRWRKIVSWYLVIDFLAIFMMKDPYFILGPDHHSHELPAHLQRVPSWLLLAYRELFTVVGIYGAIVAVFSVSDLIQYWLTNRCFPSRGGVWQFASVYGSFETVLDRGLAGWWGAWWHQTFRTQFLAPIAYLVREGYLKKGAWFTSMVTLLASFLQSGIFHASGSLTSIPRTKPWRAPVFFLLQAVGILIQQGLSQVVKLYILHPPRILFRTANLLFTLIWLYFTASFFADDCASSGLWLMEPVPISLFRFLGFGYPGDHWWRWNSDGFSGPYVGKHWWQSGIPL